MLSACGNQTNIHAVEEKYKRRTEKARRGVGDGIFPEPPPPLVPDRVQFQNESYAKLSYPFLGLAMSANTVSLASDMKAPSRKKLMVRPFLLHLSHVHVEDSVSLSCARLTFESSHHLFSSCLVCAIAADTRGSLQRE